MGEIVPFRPAPPRDPIPPAAAPRPTARPPLSKMEELRRLEIFDALARECRALHALHPRARCVVSSSPQGAPIHERRWSAYVLDDRGRPHFFMESRPSDEIDVFAGGVRAGMRRWTEIVERRSSIRTVD